MAIRFEGAGAAGKAVLRQSVQSTGRTWLDFLVAVKWWPWAIALGMGSGIAVGYLVARITLGW